MREHAGDYPSEFAAIRAVAARLGIGSAETLRKWVRQAEVDAGQAPEVTMAEATQVRDLKRKVAEPEQTLAILVEATRFMAREGHPPQAGYGEVSADRVSSRNGYRRREWDTRAGTVELAIPRLRQGSYYPEWLLERRRRAERALAVVATSYLLGVSTRRVEKLAESRASPSCRRCR